MSKLKNVRDKSDVPIIYLSGTVGIPPELEKEFLTRSGCKHRCFSFAYVGKIADKKAFYYGDIPRQAYDMCVSQGIEIMMDSSAFSFFKFVTKFDSKLKGKKGVEKKWKADIDKLREDTIELYIEWVKQEKRHWDFYVNFDYKVHSPTIYGMQQRMEKEGLTPTPVVHGDDGLDWMRKYIDEGHRLICIGHPIYLHPSHKDLKYYFDKVFNLAEKHNVSLHGLAVTSLSLMFGFPWYSVDSASWAKVAAYGCVILPDVEKNRVSTVHLTDRASAVTDSYEKMDSASKKQLRRRIEDLGFDLGALRKDAQERRIFNAWVFGHLAKFRDQIHSATKVNWGRLL